MRFGQEYFCLSFSSRCKIQKNAVSKRSWTYRWFSTLILSFCSLQVQLNGLDSYTGIKDCLPIQSFLPLVYWSLIQKGHSNVNRNSSSSSSSFHINSEIDHHPTLFCPGKLFNCQCIPLSPLLAVTSLTIFLLHILISRSLRRLPCGF